MTHHPLQLQRRRPDRWYQAHMYPDVVDLVSMSSPLTRTDDQRHSQQGRSPVEMIGERRTVPQASTPAGHELMQNISRQMCQDLRL